MRIRFASLLIACLATVSSVAALADTITLKADYYMPYNGDGKAETGYMIDIAKAVFEPLGHKVVFIQGPWDKDVTEGRAGKCTGVVGAGVNDAKGFVYPSEEQALSVMLFCVKSGSPWKYEGINSLKTLKLGVVKDYSYFDELDAYIKANPTNLVIGTGDAPLQENLNKLVQGEVGAVVDDRSVLKYMIKKMNLQGKVTIATTTSEATKPFKLFIAFSPALPKSKEYAKSLSDGMLTLRKSGELQKILAKYGLTDWK
jgi:polar amino acid transport system substrate-binding protein